MTETSCPLKSRRTKNKGKTNLYAFDKTKFNTGQATGDRFEIPGTLPGMNEILKAANAHRLKYNEMKRSCTEYVSLCAKAWKVQPPIGMVTIRITWICKDKRRDKDNIACGTKFLADGLQKAGILDNDGWKQVDGYEHHFDIDKDNPRIIVELIEKE